jgi:nitrous oxide reductase
MSDIENKPDRAKADRRGFLKGAAIAGAAAAAIPLAAQGQGGEEAPKEKGDAQVKARYQKTPHVDRFYFLNSI